MPARPSCETALLLSVQELPGRGRRCPRAREVFLRRQGSLAACPCPWRRGRMLDHLHPAGDDPRNLAPAGRKGRGKTALRKWHVGEADARSACMRRRGLGAFSLS